MLTSDAHDNVARLKRALITGITGQDGSYLAEYLLALGYDVHGLVRQRSLENPTGDSELLLRCTLHVSGLDSFPAFYQIMSDTQFDECYHLAAESFVDERMADGFHAIFNNMNSTHHLLAALSVIQPRCRFYFAGTSEMFGSPATSPQNEDTPFMPRTAYGISKLTSYHLMRHYRESRGMFCVAGFFYNHESPRRQPEFVTRKITRAVARIARGDLRKLELGNLDATRDWGYAPDYVKAMHLMLNQAEQQDYVVASGVSRTVREFCNTAFGHAGLDWREHVQTSDKFYRAEGKVPLVGDASRIRQALGWDPVKTFDDMVREMVEHDLAAT